jgi:signal transduction histidine kinase/CHASE2 domain-containing sensor protein
MVEPKPKRRNLASAALIVLASALLGILADWRAPGIGRYASDLLMRERGPLPVPPDIAIVAIDEKSIAAFGRFPWSRQVLAKTIDVLAGYEPKVIAVDVLFPDATIPEDDEMLARSIGRAGNVVLAAQLIDSPVHGGPAAWLKPMPAFAAAAAGVGHVNVQVELDGTARQIAVQAADDSGQPLRALPVEAVRVADRTPERSVSLTGGTLVMGARAIPLAVSPPPVLIGQASKRLQTGRITIDYIGPAGSFEPVTYSVSDVLSGVIPGSRFRGMCVLVGATAASQGDRVASPFVHQTDAHADEHGVLMPGVEVLANAVNTVLRSRFYSETSDWGSFLWAALIASVTLLVLDRAQGQFEAARVAAALAALAAATVLAAYLEFTRLLIFPPLVPGLLALATAAIMGLVWRSLAASTQLDAGIAQLSESSDILGAPHDPPESLKRGWLPRGLEWKAREIQQLNARLVERARFVDLALKSVEDGLIIATSAGTITFANSSAAAILQAPPGALAGQNLFERLGLTGADLPRRLVVDRARVEREIEMRDARPRRYVLRMAAVAAEEPAGSVYGIVASLSDVTRHYELQKTKNDVIALVSHEMRTPLTAIQGMTELLAKYDIDAGRRKEISAAINDEVKRLTGMITEYLDITRLESGATALRKAPVKVEALLQRIVLLLSPVAAQRRIQLLLHTESSLPGLFADADLLGRAVENLVSNAIKYSPDGTEVSVTAARDGHAVVLSVADHGYGIPEEDLPRIFEKFYRVPRVEDAGVPGTGLGLALVREIAELHGGTATVKSAVSVGSTFTLRLPLTDADRADSTLEK